MDCIRGPGQVFLIDIPRFLGNGPTVFIHAIQFIKIHQFICNKYVSIYAIYDHSLNDMEDRTNFVLGTLGE